MFWKRLTDWLKKAAVCWWMGHTWGLVKHFGVAEGFVRIEYRMCQRCHVVKPIRVQ